MTPAPFTSPSRSQGRASVDLSVPSSAGTSYYGACVQAVAEESDTENNCSAPAQVTVQAPQVEAQGVSAAPELPRPDLTLRGAWVDNANPARGGLFDLSTEVRNRGPTTEVDTTVRFYRSADAIIERSDTQLTTRRSVMGTNQYNEEVFVPVYVKAPSSNGVYYYGACVDEVVGESDTTNNCSAAVKVEVSHDKPELRVSSWAVVGIVRAGESYTLATSVYNLGGPSDATTLRLLQVPNRMSAPSAGTQVGEVDVPELVVTSDSPARSVRFVEFQAPATAGWYFYVMCVDAVPGESDTTNNCASPATPIEFH